VVQLSPAFRGVVGQGRSIGWLHRAIGAGAIAHAYIFEGPAGVGKHTTAKAFVKAIMCKASGCGHCHDCIRIERGTHADAFQIVPDGVTLGIEQIREIQHQVMLKPVEGSRKFFILDEAESMTTQAANAFLKTLEEPPPGVTFILVTSNVHAMLPTILSRAQRLSFNPIPPADVSALLQQRFGVDRDQAELATRVGSGVVGKALALGRGEGMERRKEILALAADLPVLDSLDLMSSVEGIASGIKKPLAEAKAARKKETQDSRETAVSSSHASFIARTLEQRAKREFAQRERQQFEDVLSTFESWFRDIMVTAEGVPELVMNLDRSEEIRRRSEYLTSEQAVGCIEAVERARRMIRRNVNPQLALEAMLFDMQECDKCSV